MNNSNVIPGFVCKTYEIFMSNEHKQHCDWNRDGTSIIIKDIISFTKNVLPKYFKHSNFQSFVRQLNMYDFHKCLQDPSNGEFKHVFFQRNREDLLVNVKRKVHIKNSNNIYNNNTKKRKVETLSDDDSTNSEGSDFDLKSNQLMLYDSDKKNNHALIKRRLENLENQCQRLESENIELKQIINDSRNKQQIFLKQMETIFQTFYKACDDATVPGLDNFAKSILENSKLLNDTTNYREFELFEDPDYSLEWIDPDEINLNNQSSNYLVKVNSLNSESVTANCLSRLTSLEDWGIM